MYICLIIILFIITGVTFLIFNRELLCPAVVVSAVFTFCTAFGCLKYNDWQLRVYSQQAVQCIITGILSFILASLIATLTFATMSGDKSIEEERSLGDIDNRYVLVSIILSLLYMVLLYIYEKRVVNSAGFQSETLSKLINSFYTIKNSTYLSQIYKLPSWLTYYGYYMLGNSVVFCYSFIVDLINNGYNRKKLPYLIIISTYPIYSVLTSSRLDLLLLVFEIIYLVYFSLNTKYNWDAWINYRIIGLLGCLVIAILGFFVISAVLLGRKDSLDTFDPINYVSIYVSGGVRNLDLYMKDIVTGESFFGKETFPSIYRALYNRNGTGLLYSATLEFRSIEGTNTGNIYTAFRRYYADFGMLGVVILTGMLGILFSVLYERAKRDSYKQYYGIYLLILSYLSRALFLMPVDDTFYEFECSLRGMLKLAIIVTLFLVFSKQSYKSENQIKVN